MRVTRGQLGRIIREEARRLREAARTKAPSARTRAGAEHKVLAAELQQLKKKLAGIKGRTPGDDGRRAAVKDEITKATSKMRGLEEGRRPMMERGREDFSDLADRTETYDQLVDMFTTAMDDTGEDFDGLVAMLRDDVNA